MNVGVAMTVSKQSKCTATDLEKHGSRLFVDSTRFASIIIPMSAFGNTGGGLFGSGNTGSGFGSTGSGAYIVLVNQCKTQP